MTEYGVPLLLGIGGSWREEALALQKPPEGFHYLFVITYFFPFYVELPLLSTRRASSPFGIERTIRLTGK
jgi:hypothetical protein